MITGFLGGEGLARFSFLEVTISKCQEMPDFILQTLGSYPWFL